MDNYKKLIEEAIIMNDGSPLIDVMRYSLEAGGKRIRPILTLAFYEAYGGEVKSGSPVLPVAIAIEMLHTSTLIQDDLPCMDNDDMRRGKPASHKAFSESDAILAASAMAYKAISMIDNIRIVRAVSNYMSMVYDGQKLDLDKKAGKIRIYELKTCALIQAACVSGVIAAKGNNAAIKNAAQYGYSLGMAFQLIDDILDDEGDEASKADAEKYTLEALKLLGDIPNNGFLTELTKDLLNRKN
jgi:geranylgeranyl diphosphate synthase type II